MYNHQVISKYIDCFNNSPIEVVQSLCKNAMYKDHLCITSLSISEMLFIGKILYDVKESLNDISILTANRRLKEIYWEKWHYVYSNIERRIKAYLTKYPYNENSAVAFIMEGMISICENSQDIEFDEKLVEDLYLQWLQV